MSQTRSDNNATQKIMLVINPISGTGNKKEVAPAVEQRVSELGFDLDVRLTGGRGDATRFAREASDAGYYGVIACGGDGTVNETATALCGSRTALGIIPAGSGNGLARHLGIPVDLGAALDIICSRNIVASDYGTVNDTPFFCTFGMGFDAAVSHRFARQSRRGLLSYVKSALSEYIQYRPQTYTLSANGKLLTEKAFLVAVCNASQWGNNAYIAPGASVTDGMMDITIVHDGNILENIRLGAELITGLLYKNSRIDSFRTHELSITRTSSEPAAVHIDGEPVTLPSPLRIKVRPGGLRIFVPTRTTRFVPVLTPMWCNTRNFLLAIGRLFG